MNTDILFRHMAELAMIIPAAAFAIIPMRSRLRVKKPFFVTMLVIAFLISVIAGAFICTLEEFYTNVVMFPCMILFYIPYHISFERSAVQKLFSYINSAVLCAFGTAYTNVLAAPMEIGNEENVLRLQSGLICLGVTIMTGAVFYRTLAYKLPDLFDNDSIASAWKFLVIIPIVMTSFLIWVNPLYPETIMTGRVRPISLALLLFVPAVILLLYHILWWISSKTKENAELRQRYDLLQMEEKQYRKTMRYLQETSDVRHDFRQHIIVIGELAKSGQNEKLLEYLDPILKTVNRSHRQICSDQALDAIAAHYNYAAAKKDVVIKWAIDIGDEMSIKRSDLCSVVGNLIENSVTAAEECETPDKIVSINIGMLSPGTLVISVINPYKGKVVLGKNGLPKTDKDGHGIGLRSVASIVDKYGGSMEIETDNHIFNVSIVMYSD